jgi:hypothetical protein
VNEFASEWTRLLRDEWWICCETSFLQNRPHRFSRESVGHGGIGHSAPLRVLADSNSQRPNDLIENVGEIRERIEFRKGEISTRNYM